MKYLAHFLVSFLFFLLANTTYFWEGQLGILAFPMFMVLVLFYFVLAFILIRQVYFAEKEKFKDKTRIVLIVTLLLVLISGYVWPTGIIRFEKWEIRAVLIASREGSANCTTTIKLYSDFTFSERSVCFGIEELKGRFRIQEDTIYFDKIQARKAKKYYSYAIIRSSLDKFSSKTYDLCCFEYKGDTTEYVLGIVKNELKI